MTQQYCIWIVSPENYIYSRCFEEVALSMQAAFAALGYDAPIVTHPSQVRGTAIVFGANLLYIVQGPLPQNLILYNLEQVQDDSQWFQTGYMDFLRRYPVWDYSTRNCEALARHGIYAQLCGIGYMPALTQITPARQEDIDVLFVGGQNERRMAIIHALGIHGLNVRIEGCIFGKERDDLVARSKIILNMHFYEARVFEIVRVSYMLANHKCVVSETGDDTELESPLHGGVAFVPYEGLVAECVRLIGLPEERRRIAQRGYESFARQSQAVMLQNALSAPDITHYTIS